MIIAALPRAITAALVLLLFFGLLWTKWPSSYYSTDDLVADRVSRTWYRYMLFRFGPVLVGAILVAVTGPADMATVLLASIIFGLLHAVLSAGRAMLLSAYHRRLTVRQIATDSSVFGIVIAVAIVGALISPVLRSYVPGFDKYVEVLLTGAVAALVYSYLSRWTQVESQEYQDATKRLAGIPENLVQQTVEAAARYRVDRDLALAILSIEFRQRPPWFRIAEKATRRISKTHGPFQNLDKPGSDADSVELAMRNLSGAIMSRRDYGPTHGRLNAEIERHNRSDTFVNSCAQAYHAFSSATSPASIATGSDGSPLIRHLSKKRVGFSWWITGDVVDDGAQLYAFATSPHSRQYPVELQDGRYGRQLWKVCVSVDDTQLFIGVLNPSNPENRADSDKSITISI